MRLRRQLPTWSPTSARSIVAGLGAALTRHRDDVGWVETQLEREYGANTIRLTDSGTTALRLAIEASAPAGRRRLACPAWGCYDLATAVLGAGASVVCYDLSPETLAPDPASLRAALAERPSAVLIVHWFGVPVDLSVWRREIEQSGALLIEDAAQALGGSLDGRPLGSLGSLAILSFGRGKGRTGGGGGALLANDAVGAQAVTTLHASLDQSAGFGSSARLAAQWLLGRPAWYGIPASLPGLKLGETVFHPPRLPRGLARSEAAALRANWDDAGHEAARRREAGHRWQQTLAGNPAVSRVSMGQRGTAGWLRFPVVGPDLVSRLAGPRASALGVMPGYPVPLFRHPALEPAIVAPQACPGADHLAAGLMTLPTHSLVTDADRMAIAALLAAAA